MTQLKHTSLIEEHRALGGRLVNFGGWELPVQYSGVMDEHLTCRSSAGLFDVSHMGEVHVEGPDALSFLNYLVTNDVSRISIGQAQYTVMCLESGGIVDDLIVYRRAEDRFLLVVNASNTDKDYAHIQKTLTHFRYGAASVTLSNESSSYTQIAIQGPKAEQILQTLCPTRLSDIKTYWFNESRLHDGTPVIIARTGYTGEDGFEVYSPWSAGPLIWKNLMDQGRPFGLKPVGLGARDTLRLEMKYPLYGHELTDQTHPLEAGLGWVVKLAKPDFLGKTALVHYKESGLKRKLIGLKLLDRGIPRQGYAIWDEASNKKIGEITSGTQSPSLNLPIGIGYVETPYGEIGNKAKIEIRGSFLSAEIIPTPFYKRPY